VSDVIIEINRPTPVVVNAMPAVVVALNGGDVPSHNTSPTAHSDIRASIDAKPEPYHHIQSSLSTSWEIPHGLDRKPSITTIDFNGTEVIGTVIYRGDVAASVIFAVATSGEAYCI
jgi:hypothetical protein